MGYLPAIAHCLFSARLTEHAGKNSIRIFSLDGEDPFVSQRAESPVMWLMTTMEPLPSLSPPIRRRLRSRLDASKGIIAFVSDRDGNPEIFIKTGGSGSPVEELVFPGRTERILFRTTGV
jgi:hypothetical protein